MDNKELFESLEALAASWKKDDKPMLLHEEVIDGFEMKDIDQLAVSLSSRLKVHLYPKLSPMKGKWYSSYEITQREQRLQDGPAGAFEQKVTVSLGTIALYGVLIALLGTVKKTFVFLTLRI